MDVAQNSEADKDAEIKAFNEERMTDFKKAFALSEKDGTLLLSYNY